MKYPTKLHLGCGRRKIHGFTNIDALASVKPDLCEDVFTLPSFKAASVDLIYACHVLEHSSRATYIGVLARWLEVLKPGGTLRLAVPDLRAAMQWYMRTGALSDVMGLIYGGQSDRYDHHGMGWDEFTMFEALYMTGFRDCRRYDWRATESFYVDDYSQSALPHVAYFTRRNDGSKLPGHAVSLNVEANKPNVKAEPHGPNKGQS